MEPNIVTMMVTMIWGYIGPYYELAQAYAPWLLLLFVIAVLTVVAVSRHWQHVKVPVTWDELPNRDGDDK